MRMLRLLAIGAGLLLPAAAVQAQTASFGFATFTARIGLGGNIALSSGLASASHPSTGTYDLVFSRDVTACVPVASLYNGGPGSVAVILKAGTTNTLEVTTYAMSGTLADHGFGLIASCGP